MYSILKFNQPRVIRGFTFRRGFLAVVEGGRVIAATSGFCSGSGNWPHEPDTAAFIYRRRCGKWEGEWIFVGEYDRIADERRPLEMLAVAALERADAERENLRQRVWVDEE
jgi:hypothetical protein